MRKTKTRTLKCAACGHHGLELGRAMDGRRAYRCRACGDIWTDGTHGRKPRYSDQRLSDQFHDTGAINQKRFAEAVEQLINELKG